MVGGKRVWRACFYGRISRDDGDKAESDSITNQRALVRAFAASLPDVELTEEFVDDGFSGVNFARPAFERMEQAIRDRRINCVIVKDLSRFGRNFIDSGRYLEQIFPFLGVRFIAVNDRVDSAVQQSFSDRLLLPFKNLINDAYSRDISVKIRSQLDIKRRNGDFVGAFAPYGYQKDASYRNKLVIDNAAADVVRMIFRRKIEGQSHQKIADELNAARVPTPLQHKRLAGLHYACGFAESGAAQWSAVQIGRILSNDVYIGVLAQGKRGTPNYRVKRMSKPRGDWVKVADAHEAIVCKRDFALVAELLRRDMRTAPGAERLYALSGFVRCGGCEALMTRKVVRRGNKKYCYYICRTKGCATESVSETALSAVVLVVLQLFVDILELMRHVVVRLVQEIIVNSGGRVEVVL